MARERFIAEAPAEGFWTKSISGPHDAPGTTSGAAVARVTEIGRWPKSTGIPAGGAFLETGQASPGSRVHRAEQRRSDPVKDPYRSHRTPSGNRPGPVRSPSGHSTGRQAR